MHHEAIEHALVVLQLQILQLVEVLRVAEAPQKRDLEEVLVQHVREYVELLEVEVEVAHVDVAELVEKQYYHLVEVVFEYLDVVVTHQTFVEDVCHLLPMVFEHLFCKNIKVSLVTLL